MSTRTDDASTLLMLTAVTAACRDCGDRRIFLPIEGDGPEFCCTSCDAAVFLAFVADPTPVRAERRAG